MEAPIKIGNHVWLGAYVKVGKGVCLPDDCVVAQSSLVTKQFNSPHTLIGGEFLQKKYRKISHGI